MKKGTKFLLLGGILLSILGMLVVFAGVAIAGPNNVARMINDGEFAFHINGKTLYLFGRGYNGWHLDDLDDLDMDDWYVGDSDWEYANSGNGEAAKAEDVRKIQAKITGGDIKIKESEDYSGFYIDYKYGKEPCAWKVEDGILSIEYEYKAGHHLEGEWYKHGCEITLYVPKGTSLESLEINLGGGEMEIEDIKAENTEISMGAGELIMEGLVSDSLSMKIGAGEIKAENSRVENLDVNMSMGNVVYEGELNKKGVVSCSMGNVELDLSGRRDDFNYIIDCAAGNVEIEDSQYTGLGVTKRIDNGAGKEIAVDCAMGNVEIDF